MSFDSVILTQGVYIAAGNIPGVLDAGEKGLARTDNVNGVEGRIRVGETVVEARCIPVLPRYDVLVIDPVRARVGRQRKVERGKRSTFQEKTVGDLD